MVRNFFNYQGTKIYIYGFPGGLDGKASACNVGDPGSIPGLGRSPGEGNGNPLQYSWLENPMDGGAWQATYSPWGRKESDTTERLHSFSFYGSFIPSFFKESPYCLPQWLYQFTFPTNSARGLPFLHTLFSIYCLWILSKRIFPRPYRVLPSLPSQFFQQPQKKNEIISQYRVW